MNEKRKRNKPCNFHSASNSYNSSRSSPSLLLASRISGKYSESGFGKTTSIQIKIIEVQKVLDYPNAAYEIWITNIGDVEVYLDDVYVLSPDGKTIYWHYDPGNWSIRPGDTQYLWLWTGNALIPGETYVLKVVTSDGVECYYRFKA